MPRVVQTIEKPTSKDKFLPSLLKMQLSLEPASSGSSHSTPESSGTYTTARIVKTSDQNKSRENLPFCTMFQDPVDQKGSVTTSSFYVSRNAEVYERKVYPKIKPKKETSKLTEKALAERINKISAMSDNLTPSKSRGGRLKEAMNYMDTKEINFTPLKKNRNNPPKNRKNLPKNNNTDNNWSNSKPCSEKRFDVEHVSYELTGADTQNTEYENNDSLPTSSLHPDVSLPHEIGFRVI